MNQGHSRDGASLSVILGRIFWMMAGPILLFVLAYRIVTTGNGWLTPVDLVYLAVLAALLVVRSLEFRSPHPQKATGEPATTQDLRRYLVGALVLGTLVWVGANVIGNGYVQW